MIIGSAPDNPVEEDYHFLGFPSKVFFEDLSKFLAYAFNCVLGRS